MDIKGSKKEVYLNLRPIFNKLPLSNKKNGYYKTIPDHFIVINSYESDKLFNQNGILVYDHPKSIAWGVERILFDWEKGHEIAQKGWEEIRNNYTWDAIGCRIESIYQSKKTRIRPMLETIK